MEVKAQPLSGDPLRVDVPNKFSSPHLSAASLREIFKYSKSAVALELAKPQTGAKVGDYVQQAVELSKRTVPATATRFYSEGRNPRVIGRWSTCWTFDAAVVGQKPSAKPRDPWLLFSPDVQYNRLAIAYAPWMGAKRDEPIGFPAVNAGAFADLLAGLLAKA